MTWPSSRRRTSSRTRNLGFTVLAQMCWSKNVLEERNAPDQILLGSDNPRYCVLLALGLHLEEWLATPAGVASPYLFGRSNNPKTTARRIYSILRQVFESDDFNSTAIGNLGTHSFRKYATTYARRNGCSKDDADHPWPLGEETDSGPVH